MEIKINTEDTSYITIEGISEEQCKILIAALEKYLANHDD